MDLGFIREGSWLGNNNHNLTHLLSMKSGVSLDLLKKKEATVGCQVQKNDGKRHALEKKKKKKKRTLTITDSRRCCLNVMIKDKF